MTRELRDLSLALALSPTRADDAKRAMKRYAPAVAGLLFASRDIGRMASFFTVPVVVRMKKVKHVHIFIG